jgi:hypothetical protein
LWQSGYDQIKSLSPLPFHNGLIGAKKARRKRGMSRQRDDIHLSYGFGKLG